MHGHARLARWLARRVPGYAFDETQFPAADGAPEDVARRRGAAFRILGDALADRAPRTIEATERLAGGLSDLQFTTAYRVPFPFRDVVNDTLKVGRLVCRTDGVMVTDLDGNEAYDVSGSYGVNVFGHAFYKACVEAAVLRVGALGPVLGAYHPIIADNVTRLLAISGLDEVSFHMSGTEAVMQAVRLARYHTRRTHVVRFCGAYHGWWEDVQPGPGTPGGPREVYTLRDMDERSLRALETRRDVACVLVNPIQALHPNAPAPSDGALLASDRTAGVDVQAYCAWLKALRQTCSQQGIPLIFDEVFVGFRLARGGAQEYFGVTADLVTYGKTVGGGLPIGVLCGRRDLMKRFRDDHPSDVCFARGTFNSHPYVMAAMNEFLRRLDDPEVEAAYRELDQVWNSRAARLNAALCDAGLPVRVANLASIWTVCYSTPSRYNWMFQYYLRREGLALSWVGTGRLIFSHDYTEADFAAVADRFVAAARAMHADGWWWCGDGLSNRSIKRQILREILRSGVARTRSDRTVPRAAGAAELSRRAAGHGMDR